MAAAGDALRRAGVAGVYLVHGTFVGADALGFLRRMSLIAPEFSDVLRRMSKLVIDRMVGNVGNYTGDFAQTIEKAINTPGERKIPVRLFHWSSENHHVGRADGAVRLIDQLTEEPFPDGDRVLFLAHSHGGNVLALLSNLLSAEPDALRRFFWAARTHYRWPFFHKVDIPLWPKVQEILHATDHPVRRLQLDIATFGQPIRYGWDSDGYANLMHFVHHRCTPDTPEYLTVFPRSFQEVLRAEYGDYVQQFGIAGTNWGPNFVAFRAYQANRGLSKLLQGRIPRREVLRRMRLGVRCAEEGKTWLVDYGRPTESFAEHVAGHAVYTRPQWLPFHLESIIEEFYGCDSAEKKLLD